MPTRASLAVALLATIAYPPISVRAASLAYSTYLGGAANLDEALDTAVGADGSVYLTGFTTSIDFPLLNAIDSTLSFAGDTDVFVTRLSPDGGSLVYSTYLGGDGLDGFASGGIAVDEDGNAWVVGITRSDDFPVLDPHQAARDDGYDSFVTKLAPNGALLYSTYLGGFDDDFAVDVAVDSLGAAYVLGRTQSADFPIRNAFDATPNGSLDLFLAKFDASGFLVYSTFVGGSNSDEPGAIALDGIRPVACGQTISTNFPTLFAVEDMYQGGARDCVVFALDEEGDELVFSTYLGGEFVERAFGIDVDADGSIFVAGVTTSASFPTSAGAFQESFPPPVPGASTSGFVTKFTPNGGAIAYSTFLAGTNSEQAYEVAVRNGRAYVVGVARSTDFPVVDPVKPALLFPDPADAFVSVLSPDGSSLDFSTYLGGSGAENSRDNAGGIDVDDAGNVYVAGTTPSSNFPTTPGSFMDVDPDPVISPKADLFVAKIANATPTGVATPSLGRPVRLSNYPNPFASSTRFVVALHGDGGATLEIFDVRGRRVRALGVAAGSSSIEWNGRDDLGSPLPSGVYFARLSTQRGHDVRRVLILR